MWLANGGWVCVSVEEVTAYPFPRPFSVQKAGLFAILFHYKDLVRQGAGDSLPPGLPRVSPGCSSGLLFQHALLGAACGGHVAPGIFITDLGCQ